MWEIHIRGTVSNGLTSTEMSSVLRSGDRSETTGRAVAKLIAALLESEANGFQGSQFSGQITLEPPQVALLRRSQTEPSESEPPPPQIPKLRNSAPSSGKQSPRTTRGKGESGSSPTSD